MVGADGGGHRGGGGVLTNPHGPAGCSLSSKEEREEDGGTEVRKEEGSAEAASLERRRRPRTGRGRGGWEGGAEMHQRREGMHF
jgi:hypothetical protein